MSRTDMKKHNRLKVTLNHDRKLSPNLTQSFLSTLASGQERFIWFVMTDDKKNNTFCHLFWRTCLSSYRVQCSRKCCSVSDVTQHLSIYPSICVLFSDLPLVSFLMFCLFFLLYILSHTLTTPVLPVISFCPFFLNLFDFSFFLSLLSLLLSVSLFISSCFCLLAVSFFVSVLYTVSFSTPSLFLL